MIRPDFIFPGGKWPIGTTPTPNRLRRMDQLASEIVNAEDGGTWNPASPIIFGAASSGPTLALTAAACEFTGDVETVKGNSKGLGLDEPGLIIPAGEFPALQSSRTKAPFVPVFHACEQIDQLDPPRIFEFDPVLFGARAIKQGTSPASPPGLSVQLPLRASHQGATIVSAHFYYVLTRERATLPDNQFASLRIIRVSSSNVVESLLTTDWAFDTAADPAAYFNSGNQRTIVFTPDQHNTDIAPGTYTYFLQFRDESDTVGPHGNVYFGATINLSNITDLRPE